MTDPEHVKLPMICVCGPRDEPNEREEKALARRKQAHALLDTERFPTTDGNFMSKAIGHLYWAYSAEFECAVDQWFGAYATVKEYEECEHGKRADVLVDEKVAAGMDKMRAIDEGYDEAACPDEPDCFVYRWNDKLKVTVECDRLEDGLAALVIWFHENRKNEEDD